MLARPKANVGRHYIDVRERRKVVMEIRAIVPDGKTIVDPCPIRNGPAECDFAGWCECTRRIVTQSNHNICPWAHVLWRLQRVEVGERIDRNMREILFDSFGHG